MRLREAIDFGVEVVAIDRNQVDSDGVRFGVTALHAVEIAEVENADIVEVDLTPEIVQPAFSDRRGGKAGGSPSSKYQRGGK